MQIGATIRINFMHPCVLRINLQSIFTYAGVVFERQKQISVLASYKGVSVLACYKGVMLASYKGVTFRRRRKSAHICACWSLATLRISRNLLSVSPSIPLSSCGMQSDWELVWPWRCGPTDHNTEELRPSTFYCKGDETLFILPSFSTKIAKDSPPSFTVSTIMKEVNFLWAIILPNDHP